jgi:ATP-binding protein involved in chromosome partitioning
MDIRETSDAGTPVTVTDPDGVHATIYRAIAEKVWARHGEEKAARKGPAIVFE